MSVPSTSRLDTIRSLAMVPSGALPIALNAVTVTPDGVLSVATPPQPSKLTFFADGLPFHAAVSPDGDGAVCQIWAEVCHVPFSVQDADRRRRLLTVLRGIPELERAKFVLQDRQTVLLFCETRMDGAVTAEALIHETVLLLQEARPFLRLLAELL